MYWKRDILAAIITGLLALPLIVAGALGITSPPLPPGNPPKLGTNDQVATAHTIFDPAGEVNEESTRGARPLEDEPTEAKNTEATEPQTTASRVPSEAGTTPNPREPVRVERHDEQPATTDESVSEKTKAKQPEELPEQPIQTMSPEQLRREVVNYRARVHEGQYQLTLDHSQLSVADLESITHFWCVTSERGHRFLVDRRGQIQPCEKAPDDLLIGDLGDKWPAVVAAAARDQLGPAYQATVQFALIDSAAVLLYRELSQAIGSETPRPGTEFVLSISNDNGQLMVVFKGKRDAGWTVAEYGRP